MGADVRNLTENIRNTQRGQERTDHARYRGKHEKKGMRENVTPTTQLNRDT